MTRDNLQALQEQQKLIQQERDECKIKEEEARLKCIQLLADLQICQYGPVNNNVNFFPARSYQVYDVKHFEILMGYGPIVSHRNHCDPQKAIGAGRKRYAGA